MIRVAIINSGTSNLHSIARAIEEVGGSVSICSTRSEVGSPDRVILPGVGAFREAMTNLRQERLDEAVKEQVAQGIPLLGICLGMQLLMTTGSEGGAEQGLGLIPGRVQRLEPSSNERVPHIGWNEVHPTTGSSFSDELADAPDFYFVHSYHVVCDDPGDVAAITPYCRGFASVVQHDEITGVQFHPEKSQKRGLAFLRSFIE